MGSGPGSAWPEPDVPTEAGGHAMGGPLQHPPAPLRPSTANRGQGEHEQLVAQALHWSRTSALTRYWRDLAIVLARKHKVPPMDRARVDVTVHKPTRHRYDPGNLYPTAKAIVDGLVDAGVLPDDDHVHLDGPFQHAGATGPRRLVVTITALPPTVTGQEH